MKRSFLLVILAIATLVAAGSMTLQARQQEDPYGTAAQPSSPPPASTDPATQQAEPATQTPQQDTTTTGQDHQMDSGAQQEQMPRTASALPLVAMIGLVGIGASLILRAMSRSTAAGINTFKR